MQLAILTEPCALQLVIGLAPCRSTQVRWRPQPDHDRIAHAIETVISAACLDMLGNEPKGFQI
jgi:hypothetical protein